MINNTLKSRASNNSTITNPEDLQRGKAYAHDVVPHLGCLPVQYPIARLGKHGYLVGEAGIQKGEESENSDARGRSAPFSFRIQLFLERFSQKLCTRQSRKVIWDMINTLFLTL